MPDWRPLRFCKGKAAQRLPPYLRDIQIQGSGPASISALARYAGSATAPTTTHTLSPGGRGCSARAQRRYLRGARRAVRRPAGRPAAAGGGADVSWRLPQRLSAVMSQGGQQSPLHETAGFHASAFGHWTPTSSTIHARCKATHSCLSLSPPGGWHRSFRSCGAPTAQLVTLEKQSVITRSVSLTDFILEGSTTAGAGALGDWSTDDRSARAASSASLDSNVSPCSSCS